MLSYGQKMKIRQLLALGRPLNAIGREVGCSGTTVANVRDEAYKNHEETDFALIREAAERHKRSQLSTLNKQDKTY